MEGVQEARAIARLRQLTFSGMTGARVLGLVHDAVVFLVEQLHGAGRCQHHNFRFFKQFNQEDDLPVNPSGCARSELYLRSGPTLISTIHLYTLTCTNTVTPVHPHLYYYTCTPSPVLLHLCTLTCTITPVHTHLYYYCYTLTCTITHVHPQLYYYCYTLTCTIRFSCFYCLFAWVS